MLYFTINRLSLFTLVGDKELFIGIDMTAQDVLPFRTFSL